jgi:bacillithiol biosynthesis cysteine-adding enzyme BshC
VERRARDARVDPTENHLNLELLIGPAGGTPIADDYIAGETRARDFFEGWFGDTEAYVAKAREVRQRFDRAALERAASALYAPTPAARQRLSEWVERGGYAVTTGQQPGLFTGPLYTLYKALTAARLARELEGVLDAPVLPIFWVASEDHDWAESNHTFVVGNANDLQRVEVALPEGAAGLPAHRIVPGEALPRAVQEFLALLPQSEFSAGYRELLEKAYASDSTLPRAIRDTLGALLEPFGVFLTDAADPAVKRASRPLLQRELAASEDHEKLLLDRATALTQAGYGIQVPILPGAVNLFVEGPAGRERLYRDGDAFRLRHSGERLTREQIVARMDADARTVSPNVLLRPVVEAAVFPTVSLVVGPGECAYFAQLQPYFEAFNVRSPVAHPRAGVTVLEGKVKKVLEKFRLEPAALRRPFHDVAAAFAREELPEDARSALEAMRTALQQGSAELTMSAKRVHPTLEGPVQHALSVSQDAWSDAEKKIVQAVRRESETRLAQLEKAQLHIHPNGKPQERVLNVFYYLFRYGASFLTSVADRIEIRLGAGSPRA